MAGEGIEGLTPAQQQAMKLGETLLNANPDIARDAKRLAKKANPALRIPEIELEDAIAASETRNATKVQELEQEIIKRDVQQRRRDFRAECERQGLDPDEVEKIVVAEKCSTSTAIKLALMQRDTAEPSAADIRSSAAGEPIELRPEKNIRNLQGAALRTHTLNAAHKMVDELAAARRAQPRR